MSNLTLTLTLTLTLNPNPSTDVMDNYCNRTIIVKDIVENVVTCFLGHGVYRLYNGL